MSGDCGCTYEAARLTLCADHYAALEAELEREPRVLPAMAALLRRAEGDR